LASNVALLQAASGLERLMVGVPQNGPIKDSNVAQISALLYYQANVLAGLEQNKGFKQLFKTTIFKQIEKEFGEYIDANARIKPSSLHHVYEWNRVGNQGSRLFKLKQIDSLGLSFKIDYEFKLSRSNVPSKNKMQKNKYKFANKASVMEKGMPIVIRPKSAERLVFEMNGATVFMPKGASVMVKRPGGSAATNQFSLAYSRYFSGQLVNSAIKNSGFQQIFGTKIVKALGAPASIRKVRYSFSPNAIRTEADFALSREFGGSL